MAKDDDERMADFVAKQVEREREKVMEEKPTSFTELQRTEDRIKLDGIKLDKKSEVKEVSFKHVTKSDVKSKKKRSISQADKRF